MTGCCARDRLPVSSASHKHSCFYTKVLLHSRPHPFLQASFSQALSLLKNSSGELAWKSLPKARGMEGGRKREGERERVRLKYQHRIYALDLRFNNATENQYLIKQMMEKNTAREMRLLHCFQTSQSQRRVSWQDGWETRLTRESGMQTIVGPIDSCSVISWVFWPLLLKGWQGITMKVMGDVQ